MNYTEVQCICTRYISKCNNYKNKFNFKITTKNKSNKIQEQNYYSYIFAGILVNFNAVFTCELRILIWENRPLKSNRRCYSQSRLQKCFCRSKIRIWPNSITRKLSTHFCRLFSPFGSLSGWAVLPSKLVNCRCRVQFPVTLVDLAVRRFPWFSPKLP